MSAYLTQPFPTAHPSFATGSHSLPDSSLWSGAPVPVDQAARIPVGRLVLPGWPEVPQMHQAQQPLSAPPLQPLPTQGPAPSHFAPPSQPSFLPPQPPPEPTATFIAPPPSSDSPPKEFIPAGNVPLPADSGEPDFTDDDLRQAFAPIFSGITIQAAPAPVNLHLEPMLRATIRRALAEYSPTTGRPFTNPGVWDRFKWRMRALFTSRTYEDILFEKTNRFQVEEVFLLDTTTLALVSYASTNPGRHASTKRVESTVHRLARQLRDDAGRLRRHFKLPDDLNVIVREGSFITLVAVFRGMPNEMAINDLGYTLTSIEERFGDRYRIPGSPLLELLQPFLEDCLLIQAPATAA